MKYATLQSQFCDMMRPHQNIIAREHLMRTTIDVRDDVLQAAREEAARSKRSIGEVISLWAIRGVSAPPPSAEPEYRNGIPQLPRRDEIITNEHINKLREELGI
jgi:hypothetical protein